MDKNFYFIATRSRDYNTAAIKAPKDIETILEKRDYKMVKFCFPPKMSNEKLYIWAGRFANVLNWGKAFITIRKNSLVLIQYPYGCKRMALKAMPFLQKHKKVKFILLLHDVDSLRGYNPDSSTSSEGMLKLADYVICHNDKMKEYLLTQGIKEKKLFVLGVFDYLCTENPQKQTCRNTIALAGNLSPRKSPYIDKFLKAAKNFNVNVYGPNYAEGANYINTKYGGQFSPDEIPAKICGNWGLVWDGDSLESCTGETGNYLRYNNPHKLSLYIAAGIPVIIWKEAALASYVEEKNIGITVASLRDIEQRITELPESAYKKMLLNIEIEAKKLRNGNYFETVITQIENEEENEN